MTTDLGFGEDGQRVPIAEFNYEELDGLPDCNELSPEEIDRALKLFRSLVRWLWQDGMKNTEGLTIRSIIVCWIFIEELKGLSETEMARGFGRHKQSLGRWVEQFKKAFPFIRTPHMKIQQHKNHERDQTDSQH
jgi:hypothetical protein